MITVMYIISYDCCHAHAHTHTHTHSCNNSFLPSQQFVWINR